MFAALTVYSSVLVFFPLHINVTASAITLSFRNRYRSHGLSILNNTQL